AMNASVGAEVSKARCPVHQCGKAHQSGEQDRTTLGTRGRLLRCLWGDFRYMTSADPSSAEAPTKVDYVALPIGTRVGRYEVESVLGHGGFGITYLARDTQLDREVAIKEYLPAALAVRQDGSSVLPRSTEVADDFDWGRSRFIEEGRTLASLHEAPSIV